jgi:putative inorganic carbon (HCO3(-)) transporter
MATRAEDLPGSPSLAPASPPPAAKAQAAARRSRDELRPGLILAFFYAWALATARLIDVSEDGKAMLVFGTTFSIVVLFSAVARPRWYLPLVVAYLPFSKVYALPLAGITGANMTNFLILLGPVAWLSRRVQGQRRLRFGFPEMLVLAFVGVASLSLVPAYSADAGLGELVQTYRTWLAPMLFFFIARGLVRDREDVQGVLYVLAWTAFLVAADTWKEGIDRGDRGSIDRARVRGLMVQANEMGAFLVYYGVPVLAFALTARPRRKALPYLLAFLVIARATLFTFSRGAYMALAGGAVTVVLLSNPLLLLAAGGGGAVAAIIHPSLIPESIRARLGETTPDQSMYEGENSQLSLDRSNALRLVLWQGALRMIAEHPLVGVGLGRFQQLIRTYTDFPLKSDDPHDAHNAFLLQAAEMGVPSTLLLFALFFVWGRTALRLRFRRRHPVDRRLGLAFLGSLAGVVLSCMFGSRFSDEALVGLFWILAALVIVVARLREPPLPLRRPRLVRRTA